MMKRPGRLSAQLQRPAMLEGLDTVVGYGAMPCAPAKETSCSDNNGLPSIHHIPVKFRSSTGSRNMFPKVPLWKGGVRPAARAFSGRMCSTGVTRMPHSVVIKKNTTQRMRPRSEQKQQQKSLQQQPQQLPLLLSTNTTSCRPSKASSSACMAELPSYKHPARPPWPIA